MHFAELTPIEQRVLGCLIEKRWTTPDQYPLSINGLRLACNQSTNRDPVTHYGESEISEAAQRLSKYGLARLASYHSSRATKYRHLAEEALGLDREQLAVLCVMLLRGPQTPGELKARTERLARLASLTDVDRILGELGERGYAERLERRPGQKEDRFRHRMGDEGDEPAAAPVTAAPGLAPTAPAFGDGGATPVVSAGPGAPAPAPAAAAPGLAPTAPASAAPTASAAPPASAAPTAPAIAPDDGRVSALEERVSALEADIARLREQLGDLL